MYKRCKHTSSLQCIWEIIQNEMVAGVSHKAKVFHSCIFWLLYFRKSFNQKYCRSGLNAEFSIDRITAFLASYQLWLIFVALRKDSDLFSFERYMFRIPNATKCLNDKKGQQEITIKYIIGNLQILNGNKKSHYCNRCPDADLCGSHNNDKCPN